MLNFFVGRKKRREKHQIKIGISKNNGFQPI